MKSSFMRPALALALVAGLSACGGKASFTVGGIIDKLAYPGLVLANGSDTVAPAANATTFAFPKSIDYATTYDVTVKTQPAHQTCVILNGKDTAGRLATINIVASCSTNAYTIGGTVTGLTAEGLVLTNGSTGGTVPVPKDSATFTFLSNPVTYGNTFGVTVLTQPAGLRCSVANGTRTMGDAAVTDIAVSCVPTP